MIQNNSNTPMIVVVLIIAVVAFLTFAALGGAASMAGGNTFSHGFTKSVTLGGTFGAYDKGNPNWTPPKTDIFGNPVDPWSVK